MFRVTGPPDRPTVRPSAWPGPGRVL